MLLLQYVIHKTKVGKAMRAVSLDRDAAELMGIDINKTISNTFAIGSALAGAAGVLVGIYYNSINPPYGCSTRIKSLRRSSNRRNRNRSRSSIWWFFF